VSWRWSQVRPLRVAADAQGDLAMCSRSSKPFSLREDDRRGGRPGHVLVTAIGPAVVILAMMISVHGDGPVVRVMMVLASGDRRDPVSDGVGVDSGGRTGERQQAQHRADQRAYDAPEPRHEVEIPA
jgi:hypothetical protein